MIDFINEAKAIGDEIIAIRRRFHEYPELGNEEFETSKFIKEYLGELDIELQPMPGTAVVGILRGAHPGKTVGFRADMDALPVQETTDLPFASKVPGKMHACGHEANAATLLGVAKILSKHRDKLHGNVKFFFQPDEEGWGGAQKMIEAGCMKNPDVDAVFASHYATWVPKGKFAVKPGNLFATSSLFDITVKGVTTHGAQPHNGIDPIVVGAQIVMALQTIPSRRINPADPCLVTVSEFYCGKGRSIIADDAKISGIHRSFGIKKREEMDKLLTDIVTGVAEANGATAEVKIRHGFSGVINHKKSAELIEKTASALFGEESVVEDMTNMGTEDYGYFIEDVEGAYYHVGAKNPEIGGAEPHHSGNFILDESTFISAMAINTKIIVDYLEGK